MKKMYKKITFEEWCNENDRQDLLDIWDYELNGCSPSDVGFNDKEKRWVKCERGIHESYLVRIDKFNKSKHNFFLCRKCASFGQHLIDKYGEDDFHKMWSIKNTIDPFRISRSSKKKAYINCNKCGKEIYKTIEHMYRNGLCCERCTDKISYPEKLMINLLDILHIDFIKEYSPEWIGNRRYDFYLPDYRLIIETDGGFHYRYNPNLNQEPEESQAIDLYKTNKALEHGIYVIRINCFYKTYSNKLNFIKDNILKSKLKYIFNLSNIDWNYIDRKSEKSLFVDVCNYYNDGYDIRQICEFVHLRYWTVQQMLKKGSELRICKYEVKKAKPKVIKEKKLPIKCMVIDKNRKEYKFDSVADLENKSLELFGVKMTGNSIRRVINGERKSLYGYNIVKID